MSTTAERSLAMPRAVSGQVVVVERGESAPAGGRAIEFSDPAMRVRQLYNHGRLRFTRRAQTLIAERHDDDTNDSLYELLMSRRLVAYEIPAARIRGSGAAEHRAEPSAPPDSTTETSEDGWIEVVLLDENLEAVANEAYRITLPDGTRREGHLNGQGRVRLEGFDPGTCFVQFPELRRPRGGDGSGGGDSGTSSSSS